ncbi:hypothetical protein RB601_000679 [Gaeumannomyces tritici]
MASRFSQLLVSAMLLAGLVSAQVGTMCRNQTPFLNCGANVVKTVGVTCETYTQPALKTPCVCSTLSLHYSCYTSLCPPDNLNDVYESMLNSMKCPNAPPLKTAARGGGGGSSPTTPAASAATTTAGAGAAGTTGAAAGPTAGGATANAGGAGGSQQKNGAGAGLRVGAAADALVSAGGLVGFAVAVFSVLA